MGNTNPVNSSYRGYSGGEAIINNDRETQVGDPEIVALYRDYMARKFTDWAFVKRALKIALRFFDPNKGFNFRAQDQNPNVLDYNYRFLEDTLKFIATGKRSMDIFTWGEILTDQPTADTSAVDNRHRIADIVSSLNIDLRPESLVSLWCSRQSGFYDMVISLHLLFGERVVRKLDIHGGQTDK